MHVQQQDLFASPPADKRLFLALIPPREVLPDLSETGNKVLASHSPRDRLMSSERWHITLHYLGAYPDVPVSLRASVSKACEAVAIVARPFEVYLDRLKNFSKPGNRAICLAGDGSMNQGLMDFHELLVRELARQRCPIGEARNFSPHLTLFYSRKDIDERRVDPVGWLATEFALVCSHEGHEQFGSWKLCK